jgi:hypothetical protein
MEVWPMLKKLRINKTNLLKAKDRPKKESATHFKKAKIKLKH